MPNLKASQFSKSIEDYLKVIWLAGQDSPVTTSAIATALGVSDGSVSEMLVKLSELKLVGYTRYHGAQLTPEGKRQALKLLRRHRLIEIFLINYLGYNWDEVHGEAEALEHTMSDRFTELLAARLGHPSHDLHGDLIPRADGTLPSTPDVPLAELAAGQALEVACLRTQEADVLAYLANLGVQPSQVLRVHEVEPLGSLLRVSADGLEFALSKTLATLVRGKPL